jgi:hypothetical protein
MFSGHRARIDGANEALAREHASETAEWAGQKEEHEKREAGRRRMYAIRDTNSPAAVEGFLTWHFEQMEWPRETEISFDLLDDGKMLRLDVDLPEIEDFPTGFQEVNARSDAVRWKKLPEATRRQLYMAHIHGVGLRLVGEAFAHAPSIQTIVVAGFSQRPNKQTGAIEDQYLYSACVLRGRWTEIDFENLGSLDPAAAFERFDLRRKVTKTGVFSPIVPHDADSDK